MKKTVLFFILVTALCLTAGCGNLRGDGTVPGTELNSTDDMAGTTLSNDRVLDKGGANGTDNVTIMDYLQDDTSISSETVESSIEHTDSSDDIIDNIRDGADDVIDDIQEGVDDITAPSQSGPLDATTGSTSGR